MHGFRGQDARLRTRIYVVTALGEYRIDYPGRDRSYQPTYNNARDSPDQGPFRAQQSRGQVIHGLFDPEMALIRLAAQVVDQAIQSRIAKRNLSFCGEMVGDKSTLSASADGVEEEARRLFSLWACPQMNQRKQLDGRFDWVFPINEIETLGFHRQHRGNFQLIEYCRRTYQLPGPPIPIDASVETRLTGLHQLRAIERPTRRLVEFAK
jgi:hypothetical protein